MELDQAKTGNIQYVEPLCHDRGMRVTKAQKRNAFFRERERSRLRAESWRVDRHLARAGLDRFPRLCPSSVYFVGLDPNPTTRKTR